MLQRLCALAAYKKHHRQLTFLPLPNRQLSAALSAKVVPHFYHNIVEVEVKAKAISYFPGSCPTSTPPFFKEL
ncbi:MAG: hypothetical protein ABIN67_15660 [Ferruginibacter sp.]